MRVFVLGFVFLDSIQVYNILCPFKLYNQSFQEFDLNFLKLFKKFPWALRTSRELSKNV